MSKKRNTNSDEDRAALLFAPPDELEWVLNEIIFDPDQIAYDHDLETPSSTYNALHTIKELLKNWLSFKVGAIDGNLGNYIESQLPDIECNVAERATYVNGVKFGCFVFFDPFFHFDFLEALRNIYNYGCGTIKGHIILNRKDGYTKIYNIEEYFNSFDKYINTLDELKLPDNTGQPLGMNDLAERIVSKVLAKDKQPDRLLIKSNYPEHARNLFKHKHHGRVTIFEYIDETVRDTHRRSLETIIIYYPDGSIKDLIPIINDTMNEYESCKTIIAISSHSDLLTPHKRRYFCIDLDEMIASKRLIGEWSLFLALANKRISVMKGGDVLFRHKHFKRLTDNLSFEEASNIFPTANLPKYRSACWFAGFWYLVGEQRKEYKASVVKERTHAYTPKKKQRRDNSKLYRNGDRIGWEGSIKIISIVTLILEKTHGFDGPTSTVEYIYTLVDLPSHFNVKNIANNAYQYRNHHIAKDKKLINTYKQRNLNDADLLFDLISDVEERDNN